MENRFYVYKHKNPVTKNVFYVGKGCGKRGFSNKNRNKYWKKYVSKNGFSVEIVQDNMAEQDALNLEMHIIQQIGLDKLCNRAIGGATNSGWHQQPETIESIKRKLRTRIPHPNSILALAKTRGRKLTKEHREKLSLIKKGKSRGPTPLWVREKIRQSHFGIKPSQEAIAKMRASKIGKRKRELNNHFKPEIRVFQHPIHGIFIGCSYDLRTKFGIGAACVRSIITGRQKTAKGWSHKGLKT